MFEARRNVSLLILPVFTVLACSRQPGTDSGATRVDTTASPKVVADSPVASADIRGTDWRLVALGDKPVPAPDSARAPRILLQRDSKQVAGSGGCNRLFGVYELNGEKLRFSGVGSTKMACKDGMDTEAAFLPALLRVARWRIAAGQLELSDSAGVVLAKFEAKR